MSFIISSKVTNVFCLYSSNTRFTPSRKLFFRVAGNYEVESLIAPDPDIGDQNYNVFKFYRPKSYSILVLKQSDKKIE